MAVTIGNSTVRSSSDTIAGASTTRSSGTSSAGSAYARSGQIAGIRGTTSFLRNYVNIKPSWPTNIVSGDTVYAFVLGTATSVATPDGWTRIVSTNVYGQVGIFKHVYTYGDIAPTWITQSGYYIEVGYVAVFGTYGEDVINSSYNYNTTTTDSMPAVAETFDNELTLYASMTGKGQTGVTTSAPNTQPIMDGYYSHILTPTGLGSKGTLASNTLTYSSSSVASQRNVYGISLYTQPVFTDIGTGSVVDSTSSVSNSVRQQTYAANVTNANTAISNTLRSFVGTAGTWLTRTAFSSTSRISNATAIALIQASSPKTSALRTDASTANFVLGRTASQSTIRTLISPAQSQLQIATGTSLTARSAYYATFVSPGSQSFDSSIRNNTATGNVTTVTNANFLPVRSLNVLASSIKLGYSDIANPLKFATATVPITLVSNSLSNTVRTALENIFVHLGFSSVIKKLTGKEINVVTNVVQTHNFNTLVTTRKNLATTFVSKKDYLINVQTDRN